MKLYLKLPTLPDWKSPVFDGKQGMEVEPEYGALLYALVRIHKPKICIETGAYIGESSEWIARGLRDNKVGKLITCDTDSEYVEKARRRLEGLPAEVFQQDGLEIIRRMRHMDFVHLDGGDPADRFRQLRLIGEHNLAPGGLVCWHDAVVWCPDMYDYFAAKFDWPHLILPTPVGVAIFQRPAMSTTDEISAITQILEKCGRPCIVELGAYHGEDSQWLLGAVMERRPTYIMVEPDPGNIAVIKTNGYRGTLIEAAISDHTGTCEFWACHTDEGRGSGSIRKPTGHLVAKPWYDFRKLPKPIPCFKLDDIYRDYNLDHIDLLWVDIQGAERDMIAGGAEALAHTRFMLIEAEEWEAYDGQAIRPELVKMLPDWSVLAVFEQNLLMRNNAVMHEEFEKMPELGPPPDLIISPTALATGSACPYCGSRAIGIAGGMRRCNQCGLQFV